MVEAIATLSIVTTEFAIIAVIGCLLAKALGVDEIVEEIERAHKCANTRELKRN